MSPRARKRVRVLALLVGLLVIGWLGSSAFVAWRLTQPVGSRGPEAAPDDLRIVVRDVRLATRDHEDLGAWWIDGAPGQPVVVLMHGLHGNRIALCRRIRMLRDGGCPMLALTLRGHGDSSGDRVDAGWSSKLDVVAAIDWIEHHRPGSRIVIDGASMGAAAATFAAEELGDRVAGYVLECPYRDLATAIRNRLDMQLPPPLALIADTGLRLVSPVFVPDFDRISPARAASAIPATTPVMILAGEQDQHAPLDEARDVLASVASHGELVVFPDTVHDRLVETHPDLWIRTVRGFLDRVAAQPSRAR